MTLSVDALGIEKLSVEDRLQLVAAIWNTITEAPQATLMTAAQRTELASRMADDDANPHDVMAWKDVESRLRTRLTP